MTHTPGPWEIKESTGWDGAWCDWHDVGPISLMGPKANVNSRLIAAAPDLLEIVKRIADGERSDAGHTALRDAAVAAISKATHKPQKE